MDVVRKSGIVLGFIILAAFFVVYASGCSAQNPGRISALDKNADLSKFFENIRQAPGNADAHFFLGIHYQERGNHREAIREFRRAISIGPDSVRAYNGLGVSLDQIGSYAEAQQAYRAGLALDPGLAYMQNNLGYSYLLSGDADQAVCAFEKAIALDGRDTRFRNNLGLAYAEKGQFNEALQEFKLAVGEDKAYFNLAEAYLKKGMYAEAQDNYARALSLNPFFTLARNRANASRALASIFISGPNGRDSKKDPAMGPAPGATPQGKESEKTPGAPSQEMDRPAQARVTASSSPSAQISAKDWNENYYEIQAASFLSKEIANAKTELLKEKGVQCSLRVWRDKYRKEWHRFLRAPTAPGARP